MSHHGRKKTQIFVTKCSINSRPSFLWISHNASLSGVCNFSHNASLSGVFHFSHNASLSGVCSLIPLFQRAFEMDVAY